jgi:hypothetical protein
MEEGCEDFSVQLKTLRRCLTWWLKPAAEIRGLKCSQEADSPTELTEAGSDQGGRPDHTDKSTSYARTPLMTSSDGLSKTMASCASTEQSPASASRTRSGAGDEKLGPRATYTQMTY